jgi:hypothetical protein
MAVHAKMKVDAIVENFYKQAGNQVQTSSKQVTLSAVYSSDPTTPNYSFSQATPTANLTMYINNPDAFAFFEGGGEYLLTFEKVG